jgi:hypothetical protein
MHCAGAVAPLPTKHAHTSAPPPPLPPPPGRVLTSHAPSTAPPTAHAEQLRKPANPIALRLSGHLLAGLSRIYGKKVAYLLTDAKETLHTLTAAHLPGAGKGAADVDLEKDEPDELPVKAAKGAGDVLCVPRPRVRPSPSAAPPPPPPSRLPPSHPPPHTHTQGGLRRGRRRL